MVREREEQNSLADFGIHEAHATRVAGLGVRDNPAHPPTGEHGVVQIEQRRKRI